MNPQFYRIAVFFFSLLTTAALWAQESGGEQSSSSTTTTTSTKINVSSDAGEWYTQPWVWIVGGAVFILLLVALLSGGRRDTVRSERITVKRNDGDGQ